jgi:DNA-binding HxlR family transcriptional regulator
LGSEFDFQTYGGEAGSMRTVVLGELPGRACAIAASLELVGERWSLLIVRELALGNRRFSGIVEKTGAPRDRVAARLKALEQVGVVRRAAYHSAPPRFEYHLTESGRGLLPVLDALMAWGLDHAVEPDDPNRPRLRRMPRRPIERTP